MTVLTPTQAIDLGQLEDDIFTQAYHAWPMSTPERIAAWLAEQVQAHPLLQIAPNLHECPQCHALHDETAWPQIGMDDGWCSQECQDDAAQAWFEARQAAA